MLRGTVIHAWFEQIQLARRGLPSDEQLLAASAIIRGAGDARRHASPEPGSRNFARHAAAEGRRRGPLTQATYLRVVADRAMPCRYEGSSLEARNEWPFAVIDGPQIMTGRMDRVVFLHQNGKRMAADVLDFKTDAISTSQGERIEDRVEHYRPQIEAYRRTIAQQTGLPADRIRDGTAVRGQGKLVRVASGLRISQRPRLATTLAQFAKKRC